MGIFRKAAVGASLLNMVLGYAVIANSELDHLGSGYFSGIEPQCYM